MHTLGLFFKEAILAIVTLLAFQGQNRESERLSSFRPHKPPITARPVTLRASSSNGVDYGEYYVGIVAAAWTNARMDCRNWGEANGFPATLLTIESKAEMDHVRDLISQHTSAEGYWTDGVWSARNKRWQWSSSSSPVNTALLEGRDKFSDANRLRTGFSRLMFGVSGGTEEFFTFDMDTTPRRYVCKKEGAFPPPRGLRASYKPKYGGVLRQTGGSTGFAYDNYYVGIVAAAWTNARMDCRNWGESIGVPADLLTIESPAEFGVIKSIVTQHPSSEGYWTSGAYAAIARKWRWDVNRQEVPAYLLNNMLEEYKERRPTSLDRLKLTVTEAESYFSWDMDSTPRRYICKIIGSSPTPTPPPPVKHCSDFTTMSSCFGAKSGCSFCAKRDFSYARCGQMANLLTSGCERRAIFTDPDFDVGTSFPVNSSSSNPPSVEKVYITSNLIRDVDIQLLDIGNAALDLYFLMDLSASMGDDQASMVRVSNDIIQKVRELSVDARLGFGAFVDKPRVSQYTMKDYSFWNYLSLTSEFGRVQSTIASAQLGDGGDIPESQLDGLFQVAACPEIGWRPNARRVLVLMTDAPYHVAGDSPEHHLPPFNGQCALDSSGFYRNQATLDYPSETQVITAIKDAHIVPIFAITEESLSAYGTLAAAIKPSGLGALRSDSSNIVHLVADQIKDISSRVELQVIEKDPQLKIRFFSHCGQSDVVRETSICEDVPAHRDVSFQVRIEMSACQRRENLSTLVKVRAVGLPTIISIPVEIACGY